MLANRFTIRVDLSEELVGIGSGAGLADLLATKLRFVDIPLLVPDAHLIAADEMNW